LSPPEINHRLRIVIAAPMTTSSSPAPTRIRVDFQARTGLVLLEQIRELDKNRLVRRLGSLNARTVSAALSRLREMFEE
jgi:mRNA interferase MazF